MKNLEIARIFYEIAEILEMQDVQWKPQAYRKAAKAIELLSEDVKDIYKEGGLKALEQIPGVGEGIGKKIVQYIETGKIEEYEKLKRSTDVKVGELMDIGSLGPKKIKTLSKKLGVKNIKQLENAVKEHKIAKLEGFGTKSEENIQKGIELKKKSSRRMILGVALPIARSIEERLRKLKFVEHADAAGSLRRRMETIGDIDILVTTKEPEKAVDFFTSMKDVKRVLAKGPTRASIILENDIQVDLRVVEPKQYGAALQYFTGSKQHNVVIRGIAKKKGLKINEYGVFKGDKLIAGKTEAEIYKSIGLRYIEPELRENTGEIEAALNNKLPNLIGYNDIKGDLHMHSPYSDGRSTIEDMAIAAKKRGYEYIAITDHGPEQKVANGVKIDKLMEKMEEIKRLRKKIKGIKILMGTETNILGDGSLDYPDYILKKMDINIASMHSEIPAGNLPIIKRIEKAIQNENIHILGHPTGRRFNERGPYDIDMEVLFKIAKDTDTFIEVNSTETRMDLDSANIRKAIDNKLKISISTDAHSVDQLKRIEIGVAQARRAWATKEDVINTKSYSEIKKIFKIRS